jgi:hypothetical protein
MSVPIITWSGPNGAITATTSPGGVMLENSNTSDTYTSALKFIPLRALHKGNYTCQVQYQRNTESSSRYLDITGIITINFSYEFIINCVNYFIAPEIKIIIMLVGSDEAEPFAGQSYNLSCNVQGVENLDSNITYQWTKNGTLNVIRQSSSILSFSPLRLSDAGFYMCRVTISSDYLDNTLTANSSTLLNIQSI